MLNEPSAQVDRFLHVVLRGRGETRWSPAEDEGDLARNEVEWHVVKLDLRHTLVPATLGIPN